MKYGIPLPPSVDSYKHTQPSSHSRQSCGHSYKPLIQAAPYNRLTLLVFLLSEPCFAICMQDNCYPKSVIPLLCANCKGLLSIEWHTQLSVATC